MATTVRISATGHGILKEASKASGRSMQAVLEEALELYRRHRFLDEVNAAFARIRENRQAWGDELEEREAWDTTLGDGLDDV